MKRTITVKGMGAVSAKVDYVALMFQIKAQELEYDAAMAVAANQIELLECAVEHSGFQKDDLKTLHFDVETVYQTVKDENGDYQRVFAGYACSYRFKLAFDFDSQRLTAVLAEVAASGASPELNITFTVKDPSKISEELLIRAAANAKAKAEVLCRASGVELGELLSINYNWGELKVESKTNADYMMLERICQKKSNAPTIRPDDIDLRDTAAFVWEIK